MDFTMKMEIDSVESNYNLMCMGNWTRPELPSIYMYIYIIIAFVFIGCNYKFLVIFPVIE